MTLAECNRPQAKMKAKPKSVALLLAVITAAAITVPALAAFVALTWKQTNPAWKNEIMTPGCKLGDYGCLVTSVANALGGQCITIGGATPTPKVLNNYLKTNGGYTNGPNLVWAKVCQIWPGHISFIGRYWTGTSLSASQLRAYLDSGQYAILAERSVGNSKHWVVLTSHGSASSNTFFCSDPAFPVSSLNYSAFTGYGIYKFTP